MRALMLLGSRVTSMPKTVTVPDVGGRKHEMMRITVVLPAPFGPQEAEALARFDGEIDAVHGLDDAVVFDEVLCLYDGHAVPCARLPAGNLSKRRVGRKKKYITNRRLRHQEYKKDLFLIVEGW